MVSFYLPWFQALTLELTIVMVVDFLHMSVNKLLSF